MCSASRQDARCSRRRQGLTRRGRAGKAWYDEAGCAGRGGTPGAESYDCPGELWRAAASPRWRERLARRQCWHTHTHHCARSLTCAPCVWRCSEAEILNWTCSVCRQGLAGFIPFFKERENSRHVGVYVGYYPRDNKAVVVFRGTDYLVNWIQDLMVYKVDADYDSCICVYLYLSIHPSIHPSYPSILSIPSISTGKA